jgi:hypothetical protein
MRIRMLTPFIPFIFLGVLLIGGIIWAVAARQKQDAAWEQLASEIGAEFVKGGFFRSNKVQAKVREWIVTLDTFSVPSGDSSTVYTRMRAPLQSRDGFQFTIFRIGFISKLDKALGAQDIDIGDPDFDREFVIQGNNEPKVRALLANLRIRQLIQGQKSIRLGVRDNELRFEVQGVIKDVERLKSLFELFKEMLYQLGG